MNAVTRTNFFSKALLRTLPVFVLVQSFSARAFGIDCGDKEAKQIPTICSGYAAAGPAGAAYAAACQTCNTSIQKAVNLCQSEGLAAGSAMLSVTLGSLDSAKTGNMAEVKSGTETTKVVGGTEAAKPNSAQDAEASCAQCPNCRPYVEAIKTKMALVKSDAANAAGNAGQTSNAAGGLLGGSKDWLMPALLGAGAGALIGGYLGGDDKEKSSSSSEGPPKLDPINSSSSSSTSNSSSSSSSAPNVNVNPDRIDTPAIVDVPTVTPQFRGGAGDTEVFVSGGGAIVDPDDLDGGDESSSSSSSSSSLAGGGSTGGSTTLDEPAEDDVIVEDDGASLAGGKSAPATRGLAPAASPNFDFGNGTSSEGVVGSGSGMLNGTPSLSRRSGTGSNTKSLGLAGSSKPLAKTTIAKNRTLGKLVLSQLPTSLPKRTEAERRAEADAIKKKLKLSN